MTTIYVVLSPAIDYNDEYFFQAGSEEDGWTFVAAAADKARAYELAAAADWTTTPEWVEADELNEDGTYTFRAIVVETDLVENPTQPVRTKTIVRP